MFEGLKSELVGDIELFRRQTWALTRRVFTDWLSSMATSMVEDMSKLILIERTIDEIFTDMQANEGRIKVDIDSLQALTVQLVHATRNPQFIADYCMIKYLVSPKVRLSARFIYLETIKGGIDWLIGHAKE